MLRKKGTLPALTDGATIAREVVKHYEEALERGTASRNRAAVDARVFDVAYRDTRNDPIGTVRRTYDHFGMEFTPEFAERLKQHIAAERPTGADRHACDPAEFGIDQLDLSDRAPLYRARFGDLLKS